MRGLGGHHKQPHPRQVRGQAGVGPRANPVNHPGERHGQVSRHRVGGERCLRGRQQRLANRGGCCQGSQETDGEGG
jgi:hypothetical protein